MTKNRYLAYWGAIMAVLIIATGFAGLYDVSRENTRLDAQIKCHCQ